MLAFPELGQFDVVGLQLVDVWMEDPVYEADARALVRILIWELHVDFPKAAGERCCGVG